MIKIEDLSKCGVKEDERCFLSGSFCFLQVLQLYAGMVLESLERLLNVKSLFSAWQKAYNEKELIEPTEAREKAKLLQEKQRAAGGALKAGSGPEFENKLFAFVTYLNGMTACQKVREGCFSNKMLARVFMYIGFVDEFLDAASEQVFGSFDLLINSFLQKADFINVRRDLFHFSVIPFLVDQIRAETRIEALYIKLHIFTEVFYGVYDDEDFSASGEGPTELDAASTEVARRVYDMCFALMQQPDPRVFAFCAKLLRQMFQRMIVRLDVPGSNKLMKVLCNRIQDMENEDEDSPPPMSVSMFGLIFYALANHSDLVYQLMEVNLLKRIADVLSEFDNGEPIDEVFDVLNLVTEILYKFAKTDSFDRTLTLDGVLLGDLLSYFLALKNIDQFGEIYVDEVMNIVYYLSRLLIHAPNQPKLTMISPPNLRSFDWDLLNILDGKLDPSAHKSRKKINKLRRALKALK